MEKNKRDALERESRARLLGGRVKSAGVWGGVVDWRAVLRRSGVSFAGFCLARTRSYMDVFDAIYKADIAERFPAVFARAAAPAAGGEAASAAASAAAPGAQ